MRSSFLLTLLFSLLLPVFGSGIMEKIDLLYNAGDKDQAVTECLRGAMINDETPIYYHRAGMILRELKHYDRSIFYLERAMMLEDDKIKREETRLLIGSDHLLNGNYLASELILERISGETVVRNQALISVMRILILISTGREAEALKIAADSEKRKGIKDLSQNVLELQRKKVTPKKAIFMSTILPGAGQLRSGDSKNGLIALGLNGAIFYLWGSLILDGNYIDLIYYFMSFKRYYTGQREKAGMIAEENNARLNELIRKCFLEYLKENYKTS